VQVELIEDSHDAGTTAYDDERWRPGAGRQIGVALATIGVLALGFVAGRSSAVMEADRSVAPAAVGATSTFSDAELALLLSEGGATVTMDATTGQIVAVTRGPVAIQRTDSDRSTLFEKLLGNGS
jgi:hypothetical protein